MLQLILAALASFGFEQGTDLPEGFATHTYSGAAVCVWEESGRGGRSVSIASDSGADAAWQTRLAVRPGAVYRLSGWIRAEGVLSRGGRGALFNVHEIPGAATPALTGTRPWTFVECEFETGPRAEVTVNCLFGGWGEATGMAFFDDLDLELLFQPDPERPAAIIDLEREFGDLSPHIYGQFIEHLGRCINGGIWAEMLEDRKFFHQAGSFDSPWRRLAGEEGVSVAMDVERPCANDWSVKLTRAARAGTEPCGIEQRGLGVLAGREYRGRFLLAGQGSVEVALSWGEGGSEHQALAFDVDCAEFTAFSVALRAGGASEDAALSIDLQGEGGVWIGACSLMPADNVRGLRADVLDLLKQLDAPIYRWPGGNFVSGYDWRDGLGPPDQRPTRKNPAWQGIEPNDFGACEFLDFCAEVEAEPLVVVNTGLGSPELAAALVEFLNGPAESPQGRRRARLGRVEPYGVRWFGVGNEMYGDWQLGHVPLERYVVRHREFAAAMRAVDPSIKLVAVGASGEWSRRMLAECGGDMDLLSEHFYCGGADDLEEHVAQIPLAVREKAASHRHSLSTLAGRAIPIALDEWNYWYGEHVYGELGDHRPAAAPLPPPLPRPGVGGDGSGRAARRGGRAGRRAPRHRRGERVAREEDPAPGDEGRGGDVPARAALHHRGRR
ncbi:MAG: hypothetical protein HY812_09600 [Planctomycetes bacterium]|nr:hypothetical protein [Planctomycetota bacterium]